MQDDRQSIDDRQAGQRVLEFVAKLGPLEDELGLNGVGIVFPIRLDVVDVEFVMPAPRAVDDPVDEAPPKPGGQRGRVAELVAPAPGADDRLLGAVFGLVRVGQEAGGQPNQARQLGGEKPANASASVSPT